MYQNMSMCIAYYYIQALNVYLDMSMHSQFVNFSLLILYHQAIEESNTGVSLKTYLLKENMNKIKSNSHIVT